MRPDPDGTVDEQRPEAIPDIPRSLATRLLGLGSDSDTGAVTWSSRHRYDRSPMKELAGAVGRVGSQPLRLEPKLLLNSVEHRLACDDLIVGACRSGFDIDNNRVIDVDQVI